MYRYLLLFGGLAVVFGLRILKRLSVRIGEFFKSLGRKLVVLGEERMATWSRELLLKCFMVDLEIHSDGTVYYGPVFAVYRKYHGKNTFAFRCNWIATSSDALARAWEFSGSFVFRLEECGAPMLLPDGNYYFGFRDGYGIIFLGEPHPALAFAGLSDTPREFNYF